MTLTRFRCSEYYLRGHKRDELLLEMLAILHVDKVKGREHLFLILDSPGLV